MFKNVLIPTDGSSGSERAVDLAADIANVYGSALHTLYVVDLGGLPVDEDSDTWLIHEALETEGETATGAVKERAAQAGIERVQTSIRVGTPHRTILDYVTENDIDLIVMGTHGRRGLDHFLLGSVTERILRTSSVPVLTVRLSDESK
ncbi:universal stress protein (plasmid) [Haloferacaceae archaeon DSL9]